MTQQAVKHRFSRRNARSPSHSSTVPTASIRYFTIQTFKVHVVSPMPQTMRYIARFQGVIASSTTGGGGSSPAS